MIIDILDARIRAAGIPIHGVSDNGDGTYRVDFRDEATPTQQSEAAAIVAAFNPVAEQAILDALEARKVEASGGAKAWFLANPATKQLFTLTIAELETEINTLVDAIVPLATAQNRTKTKKLLMALAVSVRVLVRREGL